MTASTCPKCGFDLMALHALTIGDLRIEHDGAVILWRGKLVALSRCERLVLLSLARANGATVGRSILAEAGGYDGNDPSNWTAVIVHRVIEKFRYVDPGFDAIENIRNLGLRWKVAADA